MSAKLLVLTSIDPMTVTAMPQREFLQKHPLSDCLGGIDGNNITVITQQFGDRFDVEQKQSIIQESVKVGYEINEATTYDYLSISNPPGMFGHQQN